MLSFPRTVLSLKQSTEPMQVQIDPYNDFISEGGKVWDRLREVAEANNCIPHAIAVLNAARNAQVRQREATQALTQESVGAYMDFVNSMFSYYQGTVEQAGRQAQL